MSLSTMGGDVNDPVSLEANQNYALNSINSGSAGMPDPLVYTPNAGVDANLAYLKQQFSIDTKSNLIIPSTGLPPPDGYTQNTLNAAGHPDPGGVGNFLLWIKKWFSDMGTTVLVTCIGLLVLFVVIKANK